MQSFAMSLGPLAEQGHDSCTEQDTADHKDQSLVVFGPQRVKQEVSSQKLDQSSVDQDTSTDRVKNTRDNIGGKGVGIVGCADP